jgi:hypothetical protein
MKRRIMTKVKEAIQGEKTKEGLPREAFAIVEDPDDPDTWKLPHHTHRAAERYRPKGNFRSRGRLDLEKTVAWDRMAVAVAALSPGGYQGQRVKASPEDIIKAARHLAAHYAAADKPVPDTLGALT